jgi:hypothetical protein
LKITFHAIANDLSAHPATCCGRCRRRLLGRAHQTLKRGRSCSRRLRQSLGCD